MKKTNKKKRAFTIVELVIVIAVIAVLAAVLIPTFSNVVEKANESKALQEVQNAYIDALAQALGKDLMEVGPVEADGFKFTFTDSTGQNATIEGPDDFNYSAEVVKGVVVLNPVNGETGGSGENGGGDGNGESGGAADDPNVPVEVSDEAGLIAALTAGKNCKLTDSVTLTSAITITGTQTIDLNGQTLALGTGAGDQEWTCSPITVSGTLTITGSENSEVEIATNDRSNAGIHVQSGGTLNLTDIAVNDNLAAKGIENEGDANFTNVNFTVDSGRGLVNTGDVVISGGEFSGGEDSGYLIFSNGGTMKIDETRFSGTCLNNAIQLGTTATLDLKNVSMTTTSANVATTSDTPVKISGGSFAGTISGQFAISDGTFADVVLNGESSISDGTFSGKLTFSQNSTSTITGGTFTGRLECEKATVNIDGGTFTGNLTFGQNSTSTITGGTFTGGLTCDVAAVTIGGGTFEQKFIFANTRSIITISGGTFCNGVTFANLTKDSDIFVGTSEDVTLSLAMNNTYQPGSWTIGDSNTISCKDHTGGTATCTEKAKCEKCDSEYGEFAEHSYSEAWTSDETNHWHKCTNNKCNAINDKAGHSYTNGVCECGYECKHTPEADDGNCATPTLCSVCKQILVEAKEHNYDGGKCSVCGQPQPAVLPDGAETVIVGESANKLDEYAISESVGKTFNVDSNQFSVSFWLKTTDGIPKNAVIFTNQAGLNQGGYGFYFNEDGQLTFFASGGRGGDYLYFTDALKVSNWTHITCVVNVDTVTVYVNGKQAGTTQTSTEAGAITGATLYIGQYTGGSGTFSANTYMDEFMVFDRCISYDEVGKIFSYYTQN